MQGCLVVYNAVELSVTVHKSGVGMYMDRQFHMEGMYMDRQTITKDQECTWTDNFTGKISVPITFLLLVMSVPCTFL